MGCKTPRYITPRERELRAALEEIVRLTQQPYNFTNRIQLAAKKALRT